jgi:hypothetical protein
MRRESCLVLSLVVASTLPARAAGHPAPSYTDEDLARMRPLRAETGVLSVPAFRAEPAQRPSSGGSASHGETYWRRETERLADQLRPLRHEAEELRMKIAQAHRPEPELPASRKRGTSPTQRRSRLDAQPMELRLRTVEQEIRDRESGLEERARKEGALPGWLR